MQYSRKDRLGELALLKDLQLFKKGHSKRIRHFLWSDDSDTGKKTRIFDYHYTVGGGNSTRIYRQTVFFLFSKELGLPEFYLRPENFFHKIGHWLGKKDINFSTHPEFSDAYFLKGNDEELIRDTFSKKVLHYFTIENDWSVEGLNYFLIVYRHGKLLKPDQISHFYKKGMEIYQLLKEEGYSI
jgi:hypothetical protein